MFTKKGWGEYFINSIRLTCNFTRFIMGTLYCYLRLQKWILCLDIYQKSVNFHDSNLTWKIPLWVLILILDWQLKLGYNHSYYSLYQEDSHLTSLQHWYQLILIMSASVCTPTTWRLRRWAWSVLYFGLVLTPTVYSGRTIL